MLDSPLLDRLSGRLKPSALLDLRGGSLDRERDLLLLSCDLLLLSECIELCPSSSDPRLFRPDFLLEWLELLPSDLESSKLLLLDGAPPRLLPPS